MSSDPQTETPVKVEHTPGPWTTTGQWKLKSHVAGIFKRSEDSSYHCRTLAYVGPNPHLKNPEQIAETKANANLMAAAPDMLAALQLDATADKLERDDPEQSQMAIASFREAAKEARKAAIAKAGGQ